MKSLMVVGSADTSASPPTRGCELKLMGKALGIDAEVTPHAGVRIEIWFGSSD